jgi:hypothetical protein
MVDEAAYLVSQKSTGVDENKNPIIIEDKREIYVEELKVERSEFYQARRTGMSVSKVLKTCRWDYDGETLIEHDGKQYKIERTYPVSLDEIELICSEVL